MSVSELVARLGGVARTRELKARGASEFAIAAAVLSGDILRIRQGWYALPTLPEHVARAVRVGGALACVSAAREHGLWTPPHAGLHVAVRPSSARLRRPDDDRNRLGRTRDGVKVHWLDPLSRTLQPVPEAIALAARCCGDQTAFILLESALHQRRLTLGERAVVNSLSSRRFRRIAQHASAHSESGTESLLKLLLLSLDMPFRQQVPVPDVGRVDFLVGSNLVIEVDSRAHHTDPYRDRKRDAVLSARGKRVLRFMYSQLVYEIDEVEAAIVGAMVRGDLAG